MTKTIKNADIYTLARTVKQGVEKNRKLENSYKVGSTSYTYPEIAYIFAYAINNTKSDITVPSIKSCSGMTGDPMQEDIYESDYKDQCKRIVQYIKQYGQCPNFVYTVKSKKRASAKMFIYAFAKILVFIKDQQVMPRYCLYATNVYQANTPSSKVETSQEVLDYFQKKNEKISTIDEALAKINNRGYSYYYDDVYSNKQTIDRVYNKQGVNCTDICHVLINIAIALKKYAKVDCIHVRCSGGDGHVRMRITQKDGQVFYRDGACALSNNGRGAYCNWCTENYTLLAVNPKWFMDNLHR